MLQDQIFIYTVPHSTYKNTNYISKRTYKVKAPNNMEVIKWCRQNFGQRGDGWSFFGGLNTTIEIWDAKYAMAYELRWE